MFLLGEIQCKKGCRKNYSQKKSGVNELGNHFDDIFARDPKTAKFPEGPSFNPKFLFLIARTSTIKLCIPGGAKTIATTTTKHGVKDVVMLML